MKKNTVSKCLIWWVKEGVLKGTAQLRGPTIYELVQYPVERDIEPDINIPPEVILDVSGAQSYAPDKSEPDSEPYIPPEVMQYHSPGVPISRQECSNIPSEYPLKEPERNKENEQEKDNTYSVIRELREYLGNCLDDDRPEAIRTIMDHLDDWPDWWTKRPEEATSYYLDHQDELIDEVLRRSDTQESGG